MLSREVALRCKEALENDLEYSKRKKMTRLQQSVDSGLLRVSSQELPSKPSPARKKRKAVYGGPHEPVPRGSNNHNILVRAGILEWQDPAQELRIHQAPIPPQHQNLSPQWPKNMNPWVHMQSSLLHSQDEQPLQQQSQGQSYNQQQSSKAALGWCNVCKLNCVTHHNLKIHMQGKKHKDKLEKQSMKVDSRRGGKKRKSRSDVPPLEVEQNGNGLSLQVHCLDNLNQQPTQASTVCAWCNICELNCKNPQNLKRHLQGRKHKAKCDKQSPTGSIVKSDEVYRQAYCLQEQPIDMQSSPVWCTLCQVNCMNPQNLKRHLQGKKHKEKWKEQPLQTFCPDNQPPTLLATAASLWCHQAGVGQSS